MGFKVPQLDSCCCGCTLRTGTLIILWIYVIYGLLIVALPPLAPQGGTNSTKIDPVNTSSTPSPMDQVDWQKKIAPFGVWSVILGVITIVIGGIGLYGVYKELHLYLLPFLTWEMFYTLLTIIAELITDFTIPNIFGQLISFLIFFYFWVVVFSHYRVLKGSVRPIQA